MILATSILLSQLLNNVLKLLATHNNLAQKQFLVKFKVCALGLDCNHSTFFQITIANQITQLNSSKISIIVLKLNSCVVPPKAKHPQTVVDGRKVINIQVYGYFIGHCNFFMLTPNSIELQTITVLEFQFLQLIANKTTTQKTNHRQQIVKKKSILENHNQIKYKYIFINKIIIMTAYSIGKATKQPSFVNKNHTPGVGAYQTKYWNKQSKIVSLPSPSMTKAKKFFSSLQKFENVGPGTYNPQKSQSKIAATLKGKSKNNYNNDVPSPDKYNTSTKSITKQYSFGRASRRLKTQEGPGPGQYQFKSTFMSVGTQFTRQSKQKMKNQLFPGPGSYNNASLQILAPNRQFTFSKQRKFIASDAQQRIKGKLPGPGAYQIAQLKKKFKGGKFTHAERVFVEKSDIPGPAAYNSTNLLERKNPQAIMGSQKRLNYKDNNVPGPGSYNMPKSEAFKKKNSYAIFLQEQRLKNNKNLTPGPGSYEQKKYQVRAISISPKTRHERMQKIPGPQEYHPQYKNIKIKSPNLIFGHQDRMRRFKTEAPGPGQYKADKLKISRTFHFGKAQKIQHNPSTVGPGQYKLKPFIGIYDGVERDTKQILYV